MSRLTINNVRAIAAGVAGVRLGIGAAVLVAPRLTSRIAGIDSRLGSVGGTMLSLFAVREMVLGAAVLAASRDPGGPNRRLLLLNAACDGGDFLLLARGVSTGQDLGRLPWATPVSAAVSAGWVALATAVTPDR